MHKYFSQLIFHIYDEDVFQYTFQIFFLNQILSIVLHINRTGLSYSIHFSNATNSMLQQDARCHGRTHYRGNIILASGNQKYPMSQTT